MTYPPPQQPAPGQPPGAQGWPAPRPRPTDPGPTPSRVRMAVWLLVAQIVANLALGLPAIYLSLDTMLAREVSIPDVDRALLVRITFAVVVVMLVAIDALYVVLTVKINQGRNWARITVMVLCAMGIVYAPLNVLSLGTAALSPLLLASSLVGLATSIAILVLLAVEPAKTWFPAKSAFLSALRAARRR